MEYSKYLVTIKLILFIFNDCMKLTDKRGCMLMGLSQILNSAHVGRQKESVRVNAVDRFQ